MEVYVTDHNVLDKDHNGLCYYLHNIGEEINQCSFYNPVSDKIEFLLNDNSLILIGHKKLFNDEFFIALSEYLRRCPNSKVLFYAGVDSYFLIKNLHRYPIDPEIINQLYCYCDIELEDNFKKNLPVKNIIQSYSKFFDLPKIFPYTNLKANRDKHFLLTTIVKKDRPHRPILFEKLKNKTYISDSIVKFHTKDKKDIEYIGESILDSDWKDGHVHWDLYNRVNFEIVPETLCNDATFVTEKTVKPIIAQIPFLICSNSAFYKDFHKLGFKTFDSLIDETFADKSDLSDRIQGLVTTVDSILDSGSHAFFKASKQICEYNLDHLMYMHGKAHFSRQKTFHHTVGQWLKSL